MVGAAELTSKLIDGTFPDYDRVIPAGNDKLLEVDCKEFAEAVDRVSTISTERSRAVKLGIERGSLTVSATSPENGVAVEEVEARYDNTPLEIGFNSRYLLDITDQIGGQDVQLKMADAGSPTILCAAVPEANGASALYVLMPMRVCLGLDRLTARELLEIRRFDHIGSMLAAAQDRATRRRHRGCREARRGRVAVTRLS